jgi:hypothetical protein
MQDKKQTIDANLLDTVTGGARPSPTSLNRSVSAVSPYGTLGALGPLGSLTGLGGLGGFGGFGGFGGLCNPLLQAQRQKSKQSRDMMMMCCVMMAAK